MSNAGKIMQNICDSLIKQQEEQQEQFYKEFVGDEYE